MEYADCTDYRRANPNNKNIMAVIGASHELLTDNEVDEKGITLDLARCAINLIDSDDKKDPLVAHVLVKTIDDERMVDKTSDSLFDETMIKEIKVSTNEDVVSLPVVVGENVIKGLGELGINDSDIYYMSLDLFEEVPIAPAKPNKTEKVNPEAAVGDVNAKGVAPSNPTAEKSVDEFYVAEVKISLTKEEIITRLTKEEFVSSAVNPDDFVFKEKKKPEIDKAFIQDRELSDFEEIAQFMSKISKSIKKILHFA